MRNPNYVVLPNPGGYEKGGFMVPVRDIKAVVEAPGGGCAVFIHGCFQPFATTASREEIQELAGFEKVVKLEEKPKEESSIILH